LAGAATREGLSSVRGKGHGSATALQLNEYICAVALKVSLAVCKMFIGVLILYFF